jgi:hypothetical protein
MSTKMDEEYWAHTLLVFRACLPRRGRKAEDDRLLFEARRASRQGGALFRRLAHYQRRAA